MQGHYPLIYQQAGKGFIYHVTLRIISQGEETLVAPFYFCGFLHFSFCQIVNRKHRHISRTFLLKIFGSNRGCGLSARIPRHHAILLHLLIKCLVTRLKTNQNVRQVLLRVNSNKKCTGMKNNGLKMPEKDQIYALV